MPDTDLVKLLLILYNAGASSVSGTQIDEMLTHLKQLLQGQAQMSEALTKLQDAQAAVDAKIDASIAVMHAAVGALEKTAADIAAAGTDPVALKAVADDLNAHSAKLGAAVSDLKAATDALKLVPADPVAEPVPQADPVPGDVPPPAKTI